jgi:hypothetical protein
VWHGFALERAGGVIASWRRVKKFMQPPGNKTSAIRRDAAVWGSPQTIRQFDLPPQETRSHSPCLGGFFRRGNG